MSRVEAPLTIGEARPNVDRVQIIIGTILLVACIFGSGFLCMHVRLPVLAPSPPLSVPFAATVVCLVGCLPVAGFRDPRVREPVPAGYAGGRG
jgi:hypothetical protein